MTWERSVCCLRVFTVIVTAILWLFGGGIVGFCLWVLLDFFINQYVKSADELRTVFVIVHVIIAVGVALLIFGIIGIYGAARPRRWALIMFLICLVCVTLTLLGGTIYCFVYQAEIKQGVKDSQLMARIVKKDYGSNSAVTSAFNYMQRELHCCGGVSYTDYAESNWISTVCSNEQNPEVCDRHGKGKVPLSCCKNSYYYENQLEHYQYCLMYIEDQSGAVLPKPNADMYQTGCRESIVQFLEDTVLSVLGVALSITVLVVLLLAICLTSALIHKLRSPPLMSNHDDDVVYEMARSQEKSPYPTRGPYANLYNS